MFANDPTGVPSGIQYSGTDAAAIRYSSPIGPTVTAQPADQQVVYATPVTVSATALGGLDASWSESLDGGATWSSPAQGATTAASADGTRLTATLALGPAEQDVLVQVTFGACLQSGVPRCVATSDIASVTVTGRPTGFHIGLRGLPDAVPGTAYGVSLQAFDVDPGNGTVATVLHWKRISAPAGLKVSASGVLSGTPAKRLTAGPSSVTVQASEKVTSTVGTKRKITTTTVQATLPLTIT